MRFMLPLESLFEAEMCSSFRVAAGKDRRVIETHPPPGIATFAQLFYWSLKCNLVAVHQVEKVSKIKYPYSCDVEILRKVLQCINTTGTLLLLIYWNSHSDTLMQCTPV